MEALTKSSFTNILPELRALDANQRPLWGTMSPQHMVEHVVGSWRISNGRARVKVMLPAEEVDRRRVFLFSDKEYEKNIANPIFKDGTTPPLRKASLSDAIDQLEDEMLAFFDFHTENPGQIEVHPVFGPLDVDQWLLFQTKHMRHHLRQFGIELT